MFLTEEDMEMGRKRHTAEEIVSKLRQVDVLTAQGMRWWMRSASPFLGGADFAETRTLDDGPNL
jgi:hypothetical protein